MKREIKFRAWDKFEGKWLFGYEYPNLGGFSLIGEVVLFGELAKFSLDYYQHIIFMQFTGLQDKKKVDCYEGDILENTEGKRGVVVFYDGGFRLQTHKGETSAHYISMNQGYMGNKTIIGNIYETPDLLK